jgi:hypothetical protein
LYFRRFDPTKNKNALTSNLTELNIRTLTVNSQVTAMIAFIEFIGSFTFIIIAHLELEFGKVTTLFSLSYAIIVYFNVLPYIFLMNTSNNKNRVVEIGWMNVLRNIVGKTNSSLENVEHNSDPVSVEHNTVRKKRMALDNTGNNELYITSKFRCKQSSNNIDNQLTLHVPTADEPSGSSMVGGQDQNLKQTYPRTLDVNKLEKNYSKKPLSKQLITSAIESLRVEDEYLEYFNKLVILHENCKQGNVLSVSSLENEFSSKFNITEIPVNNTLKGKGKRKHSKKSDVHPLHTKEQKLVHGNNRNSNKDKWTPKFKGTLSERILIREKILIKLNSMHDEKEEFESLLEELICAEEKFVEADNVLY